MDLDRMDWLATRVEEAIDSDRPIVDPHHHLWDRGGSTYLVGELLADGTATHNVVKTVFVECKANWDKTVTFAMAPVGETQFVAEQAALSVEMEGPIIAGIVSHADMTLGVAAGEVLAAHDAAGNGLFRGIRHATNWHETDEIHNAHTKSTANMMADPSFVAGVTTLGEMGFSYDAWIYHTQIDELTALAQACPGTTIVLDHLGGPLGVGPYSDDRAGVRATWRQSMTALAAQPNVNLKLGGIGMDNVYGTQWTLLDRPPGSEEVAAYWSDDLRWCIDLFGPQRCMFESNFPVDRQSVTYSVLWNAFQITANGYSDGEQRELFSGTAERVYRLT